MSTLKARMSPTSSTETANDRQLAIICSERHARVINSGGPEQLFRKLENVITN